MKTTEKTIVSFHIGRGGQFHNPGCIYFTGEQNLQDLINLRTDSLYYYDEDSGYPEEGYYDSIGNLLLTKEESEKEIGIIEIDGYYDTDYCKYIDECTEYELSAIEQSTEVKSKELKAYLEENI